MLCFLKKISEPAYMGICRSKSPANFLRRGSWAAGVRSGVNFHILTVLRSDFGKSAV